jgi:hypothetical protein
MSASSQTTPTADHGLNFGRNDGCTADEAPPSPNRDIGDNHSSGGDGSNDSSARGDADGRDIVPNNTGDQLADQIASLRARARDIRDERKVLRKNLKNAQRRRSRLVKASGRLSDADVMCMLRMRGISVTHSGGSSSAAGAAEQSVRPPVL